MSKEDNNKFDILRVLAVAGARGEDLTGATQMALEAAAHYVGLNAAALYLWDDNLEVTLNVSYADTSDNKGRLAGLEEELFARLRRDKKLLSAYMSFGGDVPYHSFSMPLLQKNRPFGAIVGLQQGKRTIVAEDVFLEALASVLSISFAAQAKDGLRAADQQLLDKERLAAIIETAVTVNHEVNNPLTAILGNVQLLLLKREDLDEELKSKLKTIEASAMKIKDVTQRLMRLTTPRSVEYSDGTKMVDISEEDENK
ncbi:MAG: histidine kinase dimerization/phospho-acceptor domain-containing protein [Candidatus Zixiibacteriota bacterium]